MYAYRQYTEARPLHAVPQRRVASPRVAPKVTRKKVKIKKKNLFLEFIRLIVSLSFLALFIVFVFPTSYHSLIKQVFYPSEVPTTTFYQSGMKSNPAYDTTVNLYSLAYSISPTLPKYGFSPLIGFQDELI